MTPLMKKSFRMVGNHITVMADSEAEAKRLAAKQLTRVRRSSL